VFLNRYIGIVLDQFADNNLIDMHGTSSIVSLYKHVTNSALPLSITRMWVRASICVIDITYVLQ